MGQITLQIPQTGQPNATEDPKVASDFTTLQATINGGIDATNISAGLAQSATVNQAGQTVKGAVNTGTSESRTNTAYGLMPTPDQVTGIVLPTNGLLMVFYHATWQESVQGAASADIFIGTNELKSAIPSDATPTSRPATIGSPALANTNTLLGTTFLGLRSTNGIASQGPGYGGDVSTGQTVAGGWQNSSEIIGGPCYIFAAAGTYTVSVQFKASSGSVTVSNRKLWVVALSSS